MTEELWCPECRTTRWHFDHNDECTCSDCDTELADLPRRVQVKQWLGKAAAVAIVLSVTVGPVAWAILNIGQKPLYATRTTTVTMTEPYGIIPTIAPFVFLWILVFVIIQYMAYGPRNL